MIRSLAALICLAGAVVSRAAFELAPQPVRTQPALTGGDFELELTEGRSTPSIHSGGDLIVITAPGPAPRISAFFADGQCVLRWERNSAFALESTDDPAGGQWTLVDSIEGSPAHFQHTVLGPERKFFRLVLRELREILELRD